MKLLILILENFSACNPITTFSKQISSVLLYKSDTKLLGRWNIEHNEITVNKKIDMSNYDHCGTCGMSQQRRSSIKETGYD
jgi:hypothetical protein